MRIDAIIFDKDGTLLDFNAFWVAVTEKAVDELLEHFLKSTKLRNEVLRSVGIYGEKVDTDGILCKGTYEDMGKALYNILRKNGCTASEDYVIDAVVFAFGNNFHYGEIKPTCENLVNVLSTLKKCGKKLGLVTTDNKEMTEKTLKALKIDLLFDKIYTDDGIFPPKPNPKSALDFSRKVNVELNNTLMVGDTMNDVNFAKNAGMPIAVIAKSDEDKEFFKPYTDIMIHDVSELLTLVD